MEKTTENNILLAEFLGWSKNTVVSDGKGRYYDFICPDGIEIIEEHEDCYCSDCGRSNTTKSFLYGEDLKFHNDWNWLMLVVEKIESYGHAVEISETYCLISSTTNWTIANIGGGDYTKLSATYEAVINFIEWYNENKQQ